MREGEREREREREREKFTIYPRRIITIVMDRRDTSFAITFKIDFRNENRSRDKKDIFLSENISLLTLGLLRTSIETICLSKAYRVNSP